MIDAIKQFGGRSAQGLKLPRAAAPAGSTRTLSRRLLSPVGARFIYSQQRSFHADYSHCRFMRAQKKRHERAKKGAEIGKYVWTTGEWRREGCKYVGQKCKCWLHMFCELNDDFLRQLARRWFWYQGWEEPHGRSGVFTMWKSRPAAAYTTRGRHARPARDFLPIKSTCVLACKIPSECMRDPGNHQK